MSVRGRIGGLSPIAIPFIVIGGFIALAALYDILLNAIWLLS